ncbi:Uncharacterized protein DBV15_05284 [Temnothorax longispinosus]|uniref:Uncharacterized protein n=1 Tax=Temnothorax longispinosus TaxID=300112 RepID=A0A4S2JP72_9HYME|nr:Uncharacterized protein DBV15_05284 [Temnothorax longispinosus]
MELDELEGSVKRLNAVVDGFPIGAASLDDFKPIEEKIRAARESLMRLNARSLMLRAKYKQYIDNGREEDEDEAGDALQSVVSDTLINAKAIKLKLHTYMSKLLSLNDSVLTIQKTIEETSRVQLDLKVECQKTLFNYKNFLKEQEQLRSERLQKTNPGIVENKDKMERTIRKINIMKKLIRNFVAVSGYMLAKEPILLKMLENHRELMNIETIVKMSQSNEER